MYKIFIGCSLEGRYYANAVKQIIDEDPFFKTAPWWHEDVFRSGDYTLPQLIEGLRDIDYAILVGTPDDIVTRRGNASPVFRDNIILEYGLFSGLIGQDNVALLQIGAASLPSDLHGMTVIRVPTPSRLRRVLNRSEYLRHVLRPHVRRALNDLLQTKADGISTTLNEFRSLRPYLLQQLLTPIICHSVRRRLEGVTFGRVPRDQVQAILQRSRTAEAREVGSLGHTSRVSNFVQIEKMKIEDVDLLSSAFAQFAAEELKKSRHSNICSTRVIIERKKNRVEQRFLADTVRKLGIKPAVVDPDNGQKGRNLVGRIIDGESAIFLHDFTESGYRPKKCIGYIREYGVFADTIVTFLVRRGHYSDLLKGCEEEGVTLRPFGIQNEDGSLDLQVPQ
jgi:hypothetical protein